MRVVELTPIEEIIKQNPNLKALRGEDVINLELVAKTKDEGNDEIKGCEKYLTLNNLNFPPDVYTLSLQHVTKLFDRAVELGPKNYDGECLTGLKLFFGAVETKGTYSLDLLFQPVFMETSPQKQTTEKNTAAGEDPKVIDKKYKVYGGGIYRSDDIQAETSLSMKEVEVHTLKYTSKIQFMDQDGAEKRDFIPGTDTEGVIFPFQTIFTLLYDNNAKEVFLYNSIRKHGLNHVKHCLLLSSQRMLGSLKGKYANRSHLCPPDCNLLEYTVKFKILD